MEWQGRMCIVSGSYQSIDSNVPKTVVELCAGRRTGTRLYYWFMASGLTLTSLYREPPD